MAFDGRSARVSARRLLFISATAFVAACSLLAPTDGELTGGEAQHMGAMGGAAAGASTGAGTAGLSAVSDAGGTSSAGGMSSAGGSSSAGAKGQPAAGAAGEAGVSSLAGGGATAGSSQNEGGEAGATPAPPPPLVCDANHADCNGLRSDGCETDLTVDAHCGGCGAKFTCASGTQCLGQLCVSVTGCSDGTRDGFTPVASYKSVAGCAANWPLASLLSAKKGGACGSGSKDCQVPADACGVHWHVCGTTAAGGAEVSSRLSVDECNSKTNTGAFVIAVGDQRCPCSAEGDGAACCGAACVQQNGNCIYPGQTAWYGVINNYINVCGAIESLATSPSPHGVLCCRDTP